MRAEMVRCVAGGEDLRERRMSRQVRRMVRAVVHPGFATWRTGDDVGLVAVAKGFALGRDVGLVKLTEWEGDVSGFCARGVVMGWGIQSELSANLRPIKDPEVKRDFILKCAEVDVISNER